MRSGNTSTDLDIQQLLETARTLPAEQLPRFVGALEEVRVTALARLTAPVTQPAQHDELLSVEEAAKRLGVSRKYLYANHASLPFSKSIGARRLFSARGIEDYIRKK